MKKIFGRLTKNDRRIFQQKVQAKANKLVNNDESQNSPLSYQLNQAISAVIRCSLKIRRLAHLTAEDMPKANGIASQIFGIIETASASKR